MKKIMLTIVLSLFIPFLCLSQGKITPPKKEKPTKKVESIKNSIKKKDNQTFYDTIIITVPKGVNITALLRENRLSATEFRELNPDINVDSLKLNGGEIKIYKR